jgi:cytochrome c-type biogenesis protein CcsB
MKKILNTLFSMELMGLLIIAFAVSSGVATFIENDFGTPASKAVVYNAWWFEAIMVLLCVNLVANIFKYKMYRPEKLVVFTFHISFIVILLGAGVTRYIGYEGIMHIRENESKSTMLSDNTYVMAELVANGEKVYSDRKVILSPLSQKAYRDKIRIAGKTFTFRSIKYVANAQEVLVRGAGGVPYLVMVISTTDGGRSNLILRQGDVREFGGNTFSFDATYDSAYINLTYQEGRASISAPEMLTTMSMMGGGADTLAPFEWNSFEGRKLYEMGDLRIVLSEMYDSGKTDYTTYEGRDMNFMNALIVEVSSGEETQEVALRGGHGYLGRKNTIELNDVEITMMYGAKVLDVPFAIKLRKFILERYPGSNSPSSYASEVTVIDNETNSEMDYRIFMNNVLNYRGYRFFQSSYDTDEKGTILSVNKDAAGTLLTYIGYFLMTLGMALSLISKKTRFALLGRLTNQLKRKTKAASAVLITLMIALPAMAQHNHQPMNTGPLVPVDASHADRFGHMLVQDYDGRLKPMSTLSSELLRKVSRKNSWDGLTADQVLLGMLTSPEKWQTVPMIRVSHPELQKFLGISGKYASFMNFLDGSGYKLRNQVAEAYERKPAERSKFENDVIAVDERLNITYLVYTSELLRILPDPTDSHKTWYTPGTAVSGLNHDDSSFIKEVMPYYLMALSAGNMQEAEILLQGIKDYQRKFGADIMPSESKIDMEIRYNRMMIFDRLGKYFGMVGIIMLFITFVNTFKELKVLNKALMFFYAIIAVFFVLQTAGLAMRWYIAGRAPWSNGYESMIYISWVTVLAGLIFSRKSPMALAATAVLASIILMVAHLSWLDPEITNLVPVLKSYWLTIHVSIITASYGFLALGALLGFISLIIMILKSNKNQSALRNKIKELSYINERSLIIGLYLLTIGSFLGGIWANESWGRYWGWDPKETWSLVTILVYTFIVHMGYTPGLRTEYNFSLFSLVGFSSVIMTYFGVNYYLSGLHSYAAGDPVPIPTFVYYTIAIIVIVALSAWLRERKFQHLPDEHSVKE